MSGNLPNFGLKILRFEATLCTLIRFSLADFTISGMSYDQIPTKITFLISIVQLMMKLSHKAVMKLKFSKIINWSN